MKKLIIYFVIVCVGLVKLYAQPSASSALDRDSIQIGEQLWYTLTIKSPRALRSVAPDIDHIFGSGLEKISAEQDSGSNGEHTYNFRYRITSFDSGKYEIPPVEILVNTDTGLDTIFGQSLVLSVFSPEVDTSAEIMDIKDPLNTPFRLNELMPYLKYIAAFLILAVLVIVVLWWIRRQKVKVAEEILQPPHIRAIRRLDRLRDQKLWQHGKVKEYYIELSDIVRQYIEERFSIPAMESVTSEILEDFRKFSYDDDYMMELLESMLNLSDLVKFAREDPGPQENEMNLSQAYILIEKTKPLDKVNKEEDEKISEDA